MDFGNYNHSFPFMLNQYPYAQNPMTVDNFNSHYVRNLHSYRNGWLNQAQNTTPRMEGFVSSNGGFNLFNYPFRNTVDMGLYSGPYDNWTNLMMNANSYQMRINAAIEATEWSMHHDLIGNNNRVSSLGYDDHHMFMRMREEQWNRSVSHIQCSLEFVRRSLVSLAKDHYGCIVLQNKIDEGAPREIEMIVSNVKYHLHELMIHPYGNILIQKIFEANSVSVEQMDTILELIIGDVQKLIYVCMDHDGTRVVQKMLENLRTQNQISAVIRVMKRITVVLMKNLNSGYVIQQCLKLFPPEDKMVILDEVAEHCVDITTNRCGCSVIQNCLACAEEEAKYRLIPTLILNAAVLAVDPYGNYVVQYLVKMDWSGPTIILHVIEQLRGKYVELSMNKYGSNVVEDLLQFSEPKDAAVIVMEIINSPQFLNVAQDPFGNYVTQKALLYTEGDLHGMLCNIILSHYQILRGDRYGKKVLQAIEWYGVHV